METLALSAISVKNVVITLLCRYNVYCSDRLLFYVILGSRYLVQPYTCIYIKSSDVMLTNATPLQWWAVDEKLDETTITGTLLLTTILALDNLPYFCWEKEVLQEFQCNHPIGWRHLSEEFTYEESLFVQKIGGFKPKQDSSSSAVEEEDMMKQYYEQRNRNFNCIELPELLPAAKKPPT